MKKLLALLFSLLAAPAGAQVIPSGPVGSLNYWGVGGLSQVLNPGLAGQCLTTQGVGSAPVWVNCQVSSLSLLPPINTNQFYGNTSGIFGPPVGVDVNTILNTVGYDIARPPPVESIIYKSNVGPLFNWQALFPGTAGTVLTSGGSTNPPFWAIPGAPTGITNAQLAPMPATTVKCNPTSSTANAQDCNYPVLNVKDFGAVGNNIADDTSAIQATITAAQAVNGSVYLPSGTFKTSALLTTGCGISIRGAGAGVTRINQTSPTAGGLQINNTGSPCNFNGVSISGFQIVAGGGTSGVVNSTGTGLLVTQFNGSFSADDITVVSFGTAVDSEGVWNSRFHGINGWYFNIGLQIGCNASFVNAGGTEFSEVFFYNNPGPFGGTNIGMKECSSGGYIFKHAEFGSANTGILLQPLVGRQILYDQWDQVISDTNLADGIDIDCTNGSVAALTATNVHVGFNNGVGLKVFGSNANCQALSFQGRFRENGLQGVLFTNGAGVALENSQINANGRLSLTMTSGGSSYQAGDTLTLSGGTGGPLTISVVTVNGSGTITAWNPLTSVFYSVLPSSPNSPTGGHGSGATFTFSGTGYPLPGVETASTISSFTIIGNVIGNTASASTAEGPCYKADTSIFGQQFFAGNICISAQGGTNWAGVNPMVLVSDDQFKGYQLRNSSNAVAAITGTSAANDNGQLDLNSAGAANVQLNAAGVSYLNGGALTVGPSGITGAVGELGLGKIAATGTAPGAGFVKLETVAGTNAGTCKIIAYAGTSTTPVTIVDNIGAGC